MKLPRLGSPRAVVAFGLALLPTAAFADAPRIDSISPFGVQRGTTADVVVAGANLAGTAELIAPFGFKIVGPAAPNKEAGKWAFKVEVAPQTAVGTYVIRLKTEEGLSNPFLFSVGQLPQVAEKEDNNFFDAAQAIKAPCVVEGQASGNDVDHYRFTGKKGQRVLVDAQCARIGSGLDPTIRLTTASHKFVASADDTAGLLTDARLSAVLPEDGDYVVEISDSRYQGGKAPNYRLVIGEVPAADEVFPLGGRKGETVGFELKGGTLPAPELAAASIAEIPGLETFRVKLADCRHDRPSPLDFESLPALAVSDYPEVREPADPAAAPIKVLPPVVINGRIEKKGDEDRFNVAVTAGQKYHVEVVAADLGSALDGVLQVKTPTNSLVASADDTTAQTPGRGAANRRNQAILSPDPSLDFTAGTGQTEVSLVLKDLKGDGGLGYAYRIVVEPVTPTFDLAVGESELNLPKGGTVTIPVSITRRGHTGPVTVTLADPPKGVTVRPALIPDGQTVGIFSVSASKDAEFGITGLKVVGQATGPGGPITVQASKNIVFAQQGAAAAAISTNSVTQIGVPGIAVSAKSAAVESPEAPVEVVHGYGATVPLKVARGKDADAALALAPIMSAPNQPLAALGVPFPLPTGLTVPNGTIAAKAAEGTLTVNAAPEAPLGTLAFGIAAKGKLAGRDQTIGVPVIKVNVVRPASIEIPANIEVKAGAAVELKGKLVRKAPFKEVVTIKLDGLPAGLKADPVQVPADKTEFTVKITADAKAAAASASAKVAPAFQLNKKDYATPPSPLTVKVLAAK